MQVKTRPIGEVNFIEIFNGFTAEDRFAAMENQIFDYPTTGMSAVILDNQLIGIRALARCSYGEVMQTITAYRDRDGVLKGAWSYMLEIPALDYTYRVLNLLSLEEAWFTLNRDFAQLP